MDRASTLLYVWEVLSVHDHTGFLSWRVEFDGYFLARANVCKSDDSSLSRLHLFVDLVQIDYPTPV